MLIVPLCTCRRYVINDTRAYERVTVPRK
jgi:hypothetical protein